MLWVNVIPRLVQVLGSGPRAVLHRSWSSRKGTSATQLAANPNGVGQVCCHLPPVRPTSTVLGNDNSKVATDSSPQVVCGPNHAGSIVLHRGTHHPSLGPVQTSILEILTFGRPDGPACCCCLLSLEMEAKDPTQVMQTHLLTRLGDHARYYPCLACMRGPFWLWLWLWLWVSVSVLLVSQAATRVFLNPISPLIHRGRPPGDHSPVRHSARNPTHNPTHSPHIQSRSEVTDQRTTSSGGPVNTRCVACPCSHVCGYVCVPGALAQSAQYTLTCAWLSCCV